MMNTRDKKNVFLFGAKKCLETRNITLWDLIPPTGGMDSHVATWRHIPCTEQALGLPGAKKGNYCRFRATRKRASARVDTGSRIQCWSNIYRLTLSPNPYIQSDRHYMRQKSKVKRFHTVIFNPH